MDQHPVGSKVRSFDFPQFNKDVEGSQACYVDGEVIRLDVRNRHYEIKVTRRVFKGVEDASAVGSMVLPPFNGRPHFLGGVTDGVYLVERFETNAA